MAGECTGSVLCSRSSEGNLQAREWYGLGRRGEMEKSGQIEVSLFSFADDFSLRQC